MTVLLQKPVLLEAHHELGSFTCGVAELDDWLRRRALANQASGSSRTFVACAGLAVRGYYTLSSGAIANGVAPGRVRRNQPDPIPVAVLGRLAVDQQSAGRGLGGDLLRDAIQRVLAAAEHIGVRALLVHAKDATAAAFYKHHGFEASPIAPLTLMVVIADLRRSLGLGHT